MHIQFRRHVTAVSGDGRSGGGGGLVADSVLTRVSQRQVPFADGTGQSLVQRGGADNSIHGKQAQSFRRECNKKPKAESQNKYAYCRKRQLLFSLSFHQRPKLRVSFTQPSLATTVSPLRTVVVLGLLLYAVCFRLVHRCSDVSDTRYCLYYRL